VTPAFDVLPDRNSVALLGRGNWQTAIVDNFIDQRQPTCTKGNVTRPSGGSLSWYASTADSAMEGNQQFDTNGILLAHQYKEVDSAAGVAEPLTMTQSANEVRNNLIDGEYDWWKAQSESGIYLGYGATPNTAPPPVIGYGVSIARNAIRRADTTRDGGTLPVGAIGLGPSWFTGPHDAQGATQWTLADATLVFHNTLTDINDGLSRVGIGIDSAFSNETVAWRSVLFANSCSNVQMPLSDNGIASVRYCPTSSTSCECNGVSRDVGVVAMVDPPNAKVGDTLIYTAQVTNNSTAGSAQGVVVSVEPSAAIQGLALSSSQGSCDVSTRLCKLGTLAAGGTTVITASGQAAAKGPAALSFSVTHQESDPAVANDGDVVSIDID
jgi:hypothetical protein